MSATKPQVEAAGKAARALLANALNRVPYHKMLIITGITSVAKTIATDVAASSALLQQIIDPARLKEHGFEELPWLSREIKSIARSNPALAAIIYGAAYGFEEESTDKTSLGGSAILPLSSHKRQDYQSAWYSLSEAIPALMAMDPALGTRVVKSAINGFVQREHPTHHGSEPRTGSFTFHGMQTSLTSDASYSWYRGGFQSPQDGPALLKKFDGYLQQIANEADGEAKFSVITNTVVDGGAAACIWDSLLVIATQNPRAFGRCLLPLASAHPVMLSGDTRYQLGSYMTACYSVFNDAEREVIEESILSLSGKLGERQKAILAGCIPSDFITTSAMRAYLADLSSRDATEENRPLMNMTSSSRVFDTDAYLKSEGVALEAPDTQKLRAVLRKLEDIPATANAKELTKKAVSARLDVLDELLAALGKAEGKVPLLLSEYTEGKLAEASAGAARAAPEILGSAAIRSRLKRLLLFCAKSENPRFNAKHEAGFNEMLSWGGPSARSAAASGLLDFIRRDKMFDAEIGATLRQLARDRVCHVRLQVVQNAAKLVKRDPNWVWSELDHVFSRERTRGVVSAGLSALGNIAYLDLPRAIAMAKKVRKRFANKNAPGMAHCREMAAQLIFDIHIYGDNAEADKFARELHSNIASNSEQIAQLIARYSGELTAGDDADLTDKRHIHRHKTLALYSTALTSAFNELTESFKQHDGVNFAQWPSEAQTHAQKMVRVIDEVATRLYFASGARDNGQSTDEGPTPAEARLYREARPLLEKLALSEVAPVAHHLIETLEAFISLDPPGVFDLIAQSVRSSERGGYSNESMAVDLVVRIVKTYLADYRAIFAPPDQLKNLMDCLDVFVRAGWPAAQSLVFRLADIWR